MQIKILHLFADLMSLYGEYGNLSILNKRLTDNGHTVTIDRLNYLPDDLEGYNLVYVGSGTEEDIIEALKRLNGATERVIKSIEKTQWLVTGTAMSILGQEVTYRDEQYKGLGIVDFITEMDYNRRYQTDAMTIDDNLFCAPVIGYINTSSTYIGIKENAFTLVLGTAMGNDKQSASDGIVDGNLFATQLIGPLLVKNPHVLEWFYNRLTGESLKIDESDHQTLAYNSALSQLKNRI